MKTCKSCATQKPFDDFYHHPHSKDGRQEKCKECTKSAVRANRAAKIDYYRSYDKMRFQRDPHRRASNKKYADTDKGREVAAKARLRFLKTSPEKRAAHIILGNAVRSGRINKPLSCSRCDRIPRRRDLHGHHHDYSKPLDVEWVCVICHAEEHFPEAKMYRDIFDAPTPHPEEA